jgi:hypothetical protein
MRKTFSEEADEDPPQEARRTPKDSTEAARMKRFAFFMIFSSYNKSKDGFAIRRKAAVPFSRNYRSLLPCSPRKKRRKPINNTA